MTIVNDATSWSITIKPSIKLLKSSTMLLDNIYSTGITHNGHHMMIIYVYSTGHKIRDLQDH